MSADYSGEARDPLEHVCALLRGDITPPPAAVRATVRELAEAHRVAPLCAWRLQTRGGDVEAWFGSDTSLVDYIRTAAAIDVIRSRELVAVIDQLSIRGARPVLIKGAALAHTHYPEPSLRPRLDTDLIIEPDHVEDAIAALHAIGYERVPSTSGTLVLYQAALERTDHFGVTHALDLHWRVSNWQVFAGMLSHADLVNRAVAVSTLGPNARAPHPVHALVIACVHRAAHHHDSEELLWLYDIHLLASRLTSADWRDVIAAAERARVAALCAHGLVLASRRFHTTLAPEVVEILPRWQASAASEPSAVYLSKSIRLVDGLASDLRALPPRAGLRLLREHLFPPAEYMRGKYGVTSRRAILVSYLRRIATGLPKWFASAPRP